MPNNSAGSSYLKYLSAQTHPGVGGSTGLQEDLVLSCRVPCFHLLIKRESTVEGPLFPSSHHVLREF